jgi:hypothetical protein
MKELKYLITFLKVCHKSHCNHCILVELLIQAFFICSNVYACYKQLFINLNFFIITPIFMYNVPSIFIIHSFSSTLGAHFHAYDPKVQLPGSSQTVIFASVLIVTSVTRDRCYDFLNIFAEKFWEKNWRFWLKTKLNFEKKLIITLVFEKNANIFAENWQ